MNAVHLLARLHSLGIALAVTGGRLRVSAAKGELTDEVKEAIAGAKTELLELLEEGSDTELHPIPRGGALPLSQFQERLWVLHRLDPGDTAFNMAAAWQGSAPRSDDLVVSAVRDLARRHEILRSVFRAEDGVPRVHLLSPEDVAIDVEDISGLDEAAQQGAVAAALEAAVHRPFDLAAEAPVRFLVRRTGPDRVAVIVSAHHIAVDQWSLALLLREMAAGLSGQAPAREPPPLQYADYAAWQRRGQNSEAIAAELAWWERRLEGIPQLCAFPADRETGTEAAGAHHPFRWDAELSEGVHSLVRKEGATLYMALVAACAVALRAHTAQDDIVLGSPMGVRERPELEEMIGPFITLLVLRLDLQDDPSFAQLLKRARGVLLDAHEHRHAPFEALVQRLNPVRSFNHSPLFQVSVVLHNAAEEEGVSRMAAGGSIQDFTLYARERGGVIEGSLEYRTDLYSPELVARIADQLETVLRAAVRAPEAKVSTISLVSEAERRRLAEQFNQTAVELDPASVASQFERQVSLNADACAVRHGDAQLTYGQLNARANQLARRLRGAGVAPGVLVGVCLDRSLNMLTALLAIQKAGGAYVPLDPGFPTERLDFMLVDSGMTVLLVGDATATRLNPPDAVRVVNLDADQAALDGLDASNLEPLAGPGDIAYVIYTSGSTGRPNGVVVPHAALSNFLGSMKREPGLTADDVLAAVTTISFDIAALELYLPLITGARIELIPREIASDGPALVERLASCGATVLQATPASWRLLVEAGWSGSAALRAWCGGESLAPDLAEAILERAGELWNLYGPTETTVWSTAGRVERGEAVSVGRPIANTQVYVVDRAGQLTPEGIAGEIWIGGAGVAAGYHQRPELTAQRFLPDPFSGRSDARVYRTGDLGRWGADGRLFHLGRIDHQVKIRGFRIELGEIEAALSAFPAVRQALVLARGSGAESLKLVAYVVYHPGEDATASELRNHLKRSLPDYMVPSVFVALDSFPMTPNGKVDRLSLPDPFKNALRANARREIPAPGVEQTIARVWEELLEIDGVGPEDNFFELGGNSLLSLRVAAQVEKQTGWRMPPRALFFQTLRQVATLASREVEANGSAGR